MIPIMIPNTKPRTCLTTNKMFAIYSLESSASGVNALAKIDCSVILFEVSIKFVIIIKSKLKKIKINKKL